MAIDQPLHRAETGRVRADPPRRVLFVMQSLEGYLRFFASALELLADREHDVVLVLERPGQSPAELAWLESMRRRPNVRVDVVDHFTGSRWDSPARDIRRALEYLRHLRPEFDDKPEYRARSARRAPTRIVRLTAPRAMRSRLALGVLERLLAVLDRTAPRPPDPFRYVGEVAPDLVAVCDYGQPGSLYSAYVEAARALRIPSALCVASWDNLTTRQLIRAVPDAVLVWNDRQVREAVEVHGIPADRLVVTGAQCFDHWFTWRPRDAETFRRRVDLDPRVPHVLWAGAAINRAARTEPELVVDWLHALRGSGRPALERVGVLLRPHPKRVADWLATDFSAFANVALWPREGGMPTGFDQRADYFDSIHHSAAVVGLNTTAMIEAVIVGRPVLAVPAPEFRSSQAETFHFSYIADSVDGVVAVADSLDEHFAQLEAALASVGTEAADGRRETFLSRFVRPHGLERAATPIFVDTLERLAASSIRPWREPRAIRLLRPLIAGGIVSFGAWQAARPLLRRPWRPSTSSLPPSVPLESDGGR